MTPIPKTPAAWIAEIRAAQLDAAGAIPFGPFVGVELGVGHLFHLAPVTALKFRGLAFTRRNLKRATDAALSSYVATTSESPELARFPTVCFAFAYLASHYGLDLLSGAQVNRVMDHIADDPAALLAPSSTPGALGLAPEARRHGNPRTERLTSGAKKPTSHRRSKAA